MKPKSFTPQIWDAIENATAQALSESSNTGHPPVAAFDADGTLWNTDLGESFFKYQIEHCDLPALENLSKDAWTFYRDWKESGDPRPAYLWLAQINAGHSLMTVRNWATECVQSMSPLPVFMAQQELIDYLLKKDIEVYIVTASVKWAVEPGGAILGIPNDHVLGVATRVDNGIIGKEQAGTITYREGKPLALIEATKGIKPFFCSGNTTGDLNLLRSATHLALAVQSDQEKGSELYRTEAALQKEAEISNWLRFHF